VSTEIGKTAVTITDLQTNGVLQGEQLAQFIDLVVDETVMIKLARKLMTSGGKASWSTLGISGPVTIWGGHASDWPTYGDTSVTATDYSIQAVSVEAKVKLDDVVLPAWNIEGEGFQNTATGMLAKAFANDLEDAAINADSDGSDPYSGHKGAGMLTAFDGYYETIRTSGNVYDHAGAGVNAALFYEMWETLPTKYRSNRADWRLFVSPNVFDAWARHAASVAHTGTSEAWVTNTESGLVLYAAGIQLVSVPKIPENKPGILSQSEVTEGQFSFAILAQPDNLLVAFDPELEWKIGVESDIRRKVLYLKTGFAAGILNPEACVVAVNVLPEPATTITP